MRLHNISLNNLKRRKIKVLFVFLGLTTAVATVVLLNSIIIATQAAIDRQADEYGANILIVPKSDTLTLSYGGITVPGTSYDVQELSDQDVDKIRTIKNSDNISIVAPKVIGDVSINDTKVLLVGVNFTEELRLKKWWQVNGRTPDKTEEVLLGSEAASRLKLKIGDHFDINGKPFNVTGILNETGGSEDSIVLIDLESAQTVLDKPDKISLIEVAALCSTCPIEEIDRQLSDKLPQAKVSTLKQAVQSKIESLARFEIFSLTISLIVGFIGALIVFITMMASVNERVREIGIFRALGFRQSHVARIILLEGLIISVLGGLAGFSIGIVGAWLIAPSVTDIPISFQMDFRLFALAIGISVVIGLLASLYPAIRASRLDPSQALRTI